MWASLLLAAAAFPVGAQLASEALAPPEKPASELQRLYDEDQAERAPGKTVDWSAVQLRDEARQERVKGLVAAGLISSGADYYHAAIVMQHSNEVEDILLAHDLYVIAISKGEARAKWLAAASLDRFLVRTGRPQRFGTQFGSNHPSRPPRLAPVDPTIPDQLRRELDVPTLDEARAKERQYTETLPARK